MQPSVLPGRAYSRIDRVSRLLFHWRAADLSLTPLTGQVPTFARASDAWTIDSLGQVRKCVHSQPRWYYPLDANGLRSKPALLLAGARTNLIANSDDLSAWTSVGTPLATAAFDTLGDLSLTLLEDDDAAVIESKFQTVTFVGDGVKVVLYYVRAPATPSDGNLSVFRIQDTTAVATRLRVTHTWNADGTLASATASTGTVVKTEKLGLTPLGLPVYAIYCQTTSVTAANANRAEAMPGGSTVVSDVGKMVIGGVDVQNSDIPSTVRIKTSGGTVTTAADDWTCPVGFGPVDTTTFIRMPRPVHADCAGTLSDFPWIGRLSTTVPDLHWRFSTTARAIAGVIDTSATDASGTQNVPAGAELTICTQARALRTGGLLKLDLGTGFSAEGAPATAFAAYGNQTLRLGGQGAVATEYLMGALSEVKIAAGLYTLAQMQEIL